MEFKPDVNYICLVHKNGRWLDGLLKEVREEYPGIFVSPLMVPWHGKNNNTVVSVHKYDDQCGWVVEKEICNSLIKKEKNIMKKVNVVMKGAYYENGLIAPSYNNGWYGGCVELYKMFRENDKIDFTYECDKSLRIPLIRVNSIEYYPSCFGFKTIDKTCEMFMKEIDRIYEELNKEKVTIEVYTHGITAEMMVGFNEKAPEQINWFERSVIQQLYYEFGLENVILKGKKGNIDPFFYITICMNNDVNYIFYSDWQSLDADEFSRYVIERARKLQCEK